MSVLPEDPDYPVGEYEVDLPADLEDADECNILGCHEMTVRNEDYCETHLIEIEAEEREDYLDYLRDKRRDDAMTDEINGQTWEAIK